MRSRINKPQVIVVDKKDNMLGVMDKEEAHKNPPTLHRAISVLVFDQDKILLTRRASDKPTWPGFWADSASTHPYPGESYEAAARRRLQEELGISAGVKEVCRFVYKAKYDKTWGEHEIDVCFVAGYSGQVTPNPNEVADIAWENFDAVLAKVRQKPQAYAPWLSLMVLEMDKKGITKL